MAIFVFMQVGDEELLPSIFVQSILRSQENPIIIQCSDATSKPIKGVTEVVRIPGDSTNLMTYRLHSFAKLGLKSPAIYCDSDMGVLKPINPIQLLGEADVALCKREYNAQNLYGHVDFRGVVYDEHYRKPWGEVYPYVACFSITKNFQFWQDCLDNLMSLDSKWHFWMGDQEAMRNIGASNRYKIQDLPESIFGCLPDLPQVTVSPPMVAHFKGKSRKHLMIEWAEKQGIVVYKKDH